MGDITINGHQIELGEGRKVWAGKDGDDSWYIQFISGEGAIRRLRISKEAADALVMLLSGCTPEVFRFMMHIAIGDEKPEMRWEKFQPELIDSVQPSPQVTAEGE